MEFDAIYQGLITGEEKLALVGLGYVGMNASDPESPERQPPDGRNAGKGICGSLG